MNGSGEYERRRPPLLHSGEGSGVALACSHRRHVHPSARPITSPSTRSRNHPPPAFSKSTPPLALPACSPCVRARAQRGFAAPGA
eukprot:910304-Alexandrium_andersonii.AAC.1